MSTALAVPRPATPSLSPTARPGLGRLTRVELRKMADTRAGFWLMAAVVALTAITVVARALIGDAADHDLGSMMDVVLLPAAGLLPVAGILLVTSEWSQRTGLITFTLVPVRSRVLAAKLLAGLVLSLAALVVCLVTIAAGVLLAAQGVDGAWSSSGAMAGQAAVFLTTSMVIGIAFGAAMLASAPAIVVYFTLPGIWTALASLPFLENVAPWADPALGPITGEVLSATQWAQAGTALALWMLLPLLIGVWRITRREVTA